MFLSPHIERALRQRRASTSAGSSTRKTILARGRGPACLARPLGRVAHERVQRVHTDVEAQARDRRALQPAVAPCRDTDRATTAQIETAGGIVGQAFARAALQADEARLACRP